MIEEIRLLLKSQILILSIFVNLIYADNIDLFNNAMQSGSQHQFNLNLNKDSTIDTYGKAESFNDNIANLANTGNVNSKTIHDNASNNPNYLYNSGIQAINDCLKESDARCTTLNKYGDRDTQTQIQAYTQGLSTRYSISVSPDPADKLCSIVKRKIPINQSIATCTASSKQQNQCFNTITPSFSMTCSSKQSLVDKRFRQADPTGRCDYIDVQLSCNSNGSYLVFLASEDCSHQGFSSSSTTSFTPNIQQQSGNLVLTPTWSPGGDGCGGGNIVNLNFNYFCPINGDCLISFNATCGNNPPIYNNTFNFSSLTTKQYNYQYTKGCINAN